MTRPKEVKSPYPEDYRLETVFLVLDQIEKGNTGMTNIAKAIGRSYDSVTWHLFQLSRHGVLVHQKKHRYALSNNGIQCLWNFRQIYQILYDDTSKHGTYWNSKKLQMELAGIYDDELPEDSRPRNLTTNAPQDS